METADHLFAIYYGFTYAAIISFARVFTQRCKAAFYEKSRKEISHKWKFILSGRSHCDHCRQTIAPIYLIPVLGYLFSLGKCTKCHNKIPYIYPLEESAAFLYGLVYFTMVHNHYAHDHALTVIMAVYLFTCYYISSIDFKYFLIPTAAVITILVFAILEYIFLFKTSRFFLFASIPVTWFAMLHLINLMLPGKLGLGDIHLVFVLCLASGFPHSLYMPTLASFIAIVYFFIRHRKENWKSARLTKIPFGVFLSISFVFLKLIIGLGANIL